MPSLGKAYVNIAANLAPLKAGLKMARSITTRALSTISHAIKSIMSTIANIIKKAMLVATAAITGAVIAATKFESQLAKVATMLDSNTMPILGRYRRGLSQLAKQFGESTANLSKGLYDILSASFDAEKALDILTISSKAAVSGITDVATSVDVITGTLNAFQMGADRASEVADKLFATVKRGKLEYGDLSTVIGTAGATANIAGVSLDELLAITATATRQNINYSRAAFSVVAALQAFLKPQKEAKEIAKKYGVELSVATLKSEGLYKTIQKLSKATEEELAVISGNVRGFKAFAAAIADASGFTKDLEFISLRSAGKMQEAYDKMSQTAGFSFRRLKESVLSVARTFGAPMLKPLSELATFFRHKLGEIESWIEANAGTIRDWANEAAMCVARVIYWFEDLFDVMKSGGIGAALKKMFADLRDGLSALWDKHGEAIKNAVVAAFDAAKPYAVDLGKAIGRGALSGLKYAARSSAGKAVGADLPGVLEDIGQAKVAWVMQNRRFEERFGVSAKEYQRLALEAYNDQNVTLRELLNEAKGGTVR